MADDIYWIYTLTVKDGAIDEFKQLARELVAKTRQEVGAIAYDFTIAEDGRTVHVFEHYRDSAAIVAHVKGAFEPIADRMAKLADATGITVYGEPQGPAREITDGWGAVYMTSLDGFLQGN